MERHYTILNKDLSNLNKSEKEILDFLIKNSNNNKIIINHGKSNFLYDNILYNQSHIRKVLIRLEKNNYIKNVSKHRELVKEELKKHGITRKNNKLYYDRIIIMSRNYNLSYTDYLNILKNQNYCCAICKKDINTTYNNWLDVDHCHTTNKVRGLLCRSCNTAIGKFKDNINFLNNAIFYLTKV